MFNLIEKAEDLISLQNSLNVCNIISLDVETNSLDTLTAKLFLIQIRFDNKETFVIDVEKLGNKYTTYIIKLIKDSNKLVIGHNIKYDLKVLYNHTNVLLTSVYDTMIAEVILNNGIGKRYYSLAELVFDYCGVTLDKEIRTNFIEEKAITQEMLIYSALDVEYLLTIRNIQLEQAAELKLLRTFEVEMNLVPVVASMEYVGVYLDKDKWRGLEAPLIIEERKLEQDIINHMVNEAKKCKFSNALELTSLIGIQAKTKKLQKILSEITEVNFVLDYIHANINLGSHVQILAILRNVYDINIPNTNEKTINKFAYKYEIINMLLKYRELDKKLTSFGENFIAQIHPKDGRIHSEFDQMGAASGRFSSRGPNLQNIVSGSAYRHCFKPAPGYKYVCLDYSQEELRLMAKFSKDPVLTDAYMTGLDVHLATAASLYEKDPKEISKEQRKLGKTLNFACVPLDTLVLTNSGWKNYSELNIGDSVVGYNQDKDSLEWTKVIDKIFFENQQLYNIETKLFKFRCTGEHRWYGDTRDRKHNCYKQVIKTTNELNSEFRICTTAIANFRDKILDITPEEAGVIGWLFTDGSMIIKDITGKTSQGTDGRRRRFSASIFQSKLVNSEKIGEIKRVLSGVNYRYYERSSGIVQFLISPTFIRDLWKRANLFDNDLEWFVLQLNNEQRKEFTNAIMLAEGDKRNNFYQNEGTTLDAGRLAIFLSGKYPGHCDRIQYTGNNNVCLSSSSRFKGLQTAKINKSSVEDVFCITTGLGTFVARQGNIITVTGNCGYGSSEYGLFKNFDIPLEEGREGLDKFYNKIYTVLRDWKEAVGNVVWDLGYSVTGVGRRRYFEKRVLFDGPKQYEAYIAGIKREGTNHTIQGTGADIIKIAMYRIFSENPFGDLLRIVLQVHDELVVEVREEIAEEAYKFVYDIMLNVEQSFLGEIPAQVDGCIDTVWEH